MENENAKIINKISFPTIIVIILLLLVSIFIAYRFATSAKKPDIIVSSPSIKQTEDNVSEIVVGTKDIELSGYVSDIVDFKANGTPVLIDENGNYSYQLTLQEGVNVVRFVATDKFGRKTEEVLKIIYKPADKQETKQEEAEKINE